MFIRFTKFCDRFSFLFMFVGILFFALDAIMMMHRIREAVAIRKEIIEYKCGER